MEIIFDTTDLENRPIRVFHAMAHHTYEPSSDLVRVMREKVAVQIAEQIIKNQDFFTTDLNTKDYMLETKGEVVILTMNEYVDLCKRKFSEGIKHASYFVPAQFGNKGE